MAWTQRRHSLNGMKISLKINAITYKSQNSNKCSRTLNNRNICASTRSRTQSMHYWKKAFHFVDQSTYILLKICSSASCVLTVRRCLYEQNAGRDMCFGKLHLLIHVKIHMTHATDLELNTRAFVPPFPHITFIPVGRTKECQECAHILLQIGSTVYYLRKCC